MFQTVHIALNKTPIQDKFELRSKLSFDFSVLAEKYTQENFMKNTKYCKWLKKFTIFDYWPVFLNFAPLWDDMMQYNEE